MTADEAVAVFWRAVEAGHFADLETALFREHDRLFREHDRWGAETSVALVDAFRVRVAELLDLPSDSSWIAGLLAQGWALRK